MPLSFLKRGIARFGLEFIPMIRPVFASNTIPTITFSRASPGLGWSKTGRNSSCFPATITWAFHITRKSRKRVRRPWKNGEATLRGHAWPTVEESSIKTLKKLASFLGKEACHVFSAGYLACASAVTGFSDRKDLLLADKNLHSSLWSGIKLSGARCERFAHNNPDHLREILEYEDDSIEKILVLEGVYSMEGHIAKLPEFIQLAKEFKAFVVMDDAHGFGVLGSEGRGTADHFGMTDQVDVLCGSFSKSLAGAGGFVASTREAIDYMRSHSKQTIFSAALSPASCACAQAALEVMQEEPEHHQRLQKNLERYRAILTSLELDTWESETPAIPIVLGEKEKVYYFWKALLEKGIYSIISIAPGVPPGKDLIRTAISAAHTDEDLDKIEDALIYAKSKI